MATGLSLVKTEIANGDQVAGEGKANRRLKRSRLRRFLISVNLMKTSTHDNDGETHEKDSWNVGMIAAIVVLYITVIGGILIVAIGGSLYFLELRESQRNEEKWRQVKDYDALQNEKKNCLENAEALQGLQRYFQQKGEQIPSQFLTVKPCGVPVEDGH